MILALTAIHTDTSGQVALQIRKHTWLYEV